MLAFNRSLYIILIALFVTSCEPAPLTNGKPVTETRRFDENITAIHVYNDIDVVLVEDDEFRIEITTGENLMEKITSTVENGTLYLKNENIRYWLRSYDYPLEIKIYHNSITSINYESWGNLTSEGYERIIPLTERAKALARKRGRGLALFVVFTAT